MLRFMLPPYEYSVYSWLVPILTGVSECIFKLYSDSHFCRITNATITTISIFQFHKHRFLYHFQVFVSPQYS